ncbi:unnamed protein product, partial [Polarella glacialis]
MQFGQHKNVNAMDSCPMMVERQLKDAAIFLFRTVQCIHVATSHVAQLYAILPDPTIKTAVSTVMATSYSVYCLLSQVEQLLAFLIGEVLAGWWLLLLLLVFLFVVVVAVCCCCCCYCGCCRCCCYHLPFRLLASTRLERGHKPRCCKVQIVGFVVVVVSVV